MKIGLVNNLYPPLNRGGAENIVRITAEALSLNHEVFVLTGAVNRDEEVTRSTNLTIYRLNNGNLYHYLESAGMPVWKKLGWHFLNLIGYRVNRRVKKILRAEKPDLVMTHNLTGFSLSLPRLLWALKIRHWHVLHDYQLIEPYGSLYRSGRPLTKLPLHFWLYLRVCRRLFAKVLLVISPSKFVLEKHVQYGFFARSWQVVLPNPVLPQQTVRLRQASNKIQLLYLGQLEEYKGIRFLLEALSSLATDEYALTVAGGGSLFKKLREQYQSQRVNFLGLVPHESIDGLFSHADLTVVPSLWWENSPTVIYESYAAAVPVLVSDAGGAKELVQPGQTGYIFKSGDLESLYSTLRQVAQERANLRELGLAGQRLVADFQPQHYVKKLMQLCQDSPR
ncbi:TPA: hypothetical protein DCL28_00865 [Candidatus Komeilibacteria bacterium]|nr:MAG: putative glycosyltransferase [Parcubacteria group bacterium GW2011_GWC2_45_15]OGY92611.1 MAG: hypothetical protein A2260_01610 [Candidatus Komeilibacteria bacterium RIFOXYA2_FULL_45_9]OGY93861.1 MAG: hypothetical protein A3J95_01710 [Candidatus Komeilibacteria bacterium RIFOXYC2_FULL_45_12]HAH04095.1 hypothetical protein [Candidatus Komeilibacteria bacterium]HBR13380.1 hypothetical protein [Candidatus Komeilibacteria bacterium]